MPELREIEPVARAMAKESRFDRRILARQLASFLESAACGRSTSRLLPSPSGTTYVFMRRRRDEPAEWPRREMEMRAFVARNLPGAGETVVGITVVESDTERGFAA